MSEQISPHQRVEAICDVEPGSVLHFQITTALQAQSNADEERHREQQAALRTLLAEALAAKDAAEAKLREGDYVDKAGNTWTRATGWAHHQVCKALDAAKAEIARCREIAERDGRDYAELSAHAAEMRWALGGLIGEGEAAITLEDPRLRYVEIQVDVDALEAALAALSSSPGEALERVRREAQADYLDHLADEDDVFIDRLKNPRSAAQAMRDRAAELRKEGG